MYLSKINLDHKTAAKRRLYNAYDWHQALWSGFGDRQGNRPFVYRVDSGHKGHQVLMMSSVMPDDPAWGDWETKSVPKDYVKARQYMFQLRAHVVKRNADGEHFLTDDADLSTWLETRLQATGAELVKAINGMPVVDRFKKTGDKKPLMFNRVDFTGVLNVTDPEGIRTALLNGVGRAKSFGYGMLQII
jgi:CRISPR system Cascade subunit CasE